MQITCLGGSIIKVKVAHCDTRLYYLTLKCKRYHYSNTKMRLRAVKFKFLAFPTSYLNGKIQQIFRVK